MKLIIAVLVLAAISGLIGGITNVQRWSPGAEPAVVHYTPAGRIFALAVGVSSAIAAYACIKKRKAGWWMVSAMIAGLMLVTAWGVFRAISADVILGLYWFAQIILLAFLFRWWLRQAKRFSPNERSGT